MFPLLYLLLLHHYHVLMVAQTSILHPEELADASASVYLVKDAFDFRRRDLTGTVADTYPAC